MKIQGNLYPYFSNLQHARYYAGTTDHLTFELKLLDEWQQQEGDSHVSPALSLGMKRKAVSSHAVLLLLNALHVQLQTQQSVTLCHAGTES